MAMRSGIRTGGVQQAAPSLAAMALLVATWWGVVLATQSAIFPTPWQVVTGTLELARDGTLCRSASGWAGCAARTSR
jgi:ABC-type nitrate/sulfonate/bicarbonate transport system permease component